MSDRTPARSGFVPDGYITLFQALPTPMLLLATDFSICDTNEAFLASHALLTDELKVRSASELNARDEHFLANERGRTYT
jgi:hypothetical protein